MKRYTVEAKRDNLQGIITVGSKEGYDGCEFGIDRAIKSIDKINNDLNNQGKPTIPCIVSEGILVGRASDSLYQEKVYEVKFMKSPRTEQPNENFYDLLVEYAIGLGAGLNQIRVYLEYAGYTEIFVRSD